VRLFIEPYVVEECFSGSVNFMQHKYHGVRVRRLAGLFRAHNIVGNLSPISGPWSEGKMLIVADYSLHNIYQLNPDTGEVRAVPMSPCRPVRMTFDSESNFLYVICDESELLFRIQKKTFDGKIDKVIYSLPRSKFFRFLADRCNRTCKLFNAVSMLPFILNTFGDKEGCLYCMLPSLFAIKLLSYQH